MVESLRSSGVTGVRWFLAFDGHPVIWLVTAYDADKQRVAEQGFFRDDVCRLLKEAGLSDDLASRVGVTVESEETVARDWNGKWSHAMR